MAGPVIQGSFLCGRPAVAQRRMHGNALEAPRSLELRPSALGRPLPPVVQRRMEQAFGASFGDVRVHVGHQAQSIGARAFTAGSSIYFAPGHYDPHSAHGQLLLGHELAHVVQQRRGAVRNPFPGSVTAIVHDQRLEAEAERLAARVSRPVQAKRGAMQRSTAVVSGGSYDVFGGPLREPHKSPLTITTPGGMGPPPPFKGSVGPSHYIDSIDRELLVLALRDLLERWSRRVQSAGLPADSTYGLLATGGNAVLLLRTIARARGMNLRELEARLIYTIDGMAMDLSRAVPQNEQGRRELIELFARDLPAGVCGMTANAIADIFLGSTKGGHLSEAAGSARRGTPSPHNALTGQGIAGLGVALAAFDRTVALVDAGPNHRFFVQYVHGTITILQSWLDPGVRLARLQGYTLADWIEPPNQHRIFRSVGEFTRLLRGSIRGEARGRSAFELFRPEGRQELRCIALDENVVVSWAVMAVNALDTLDNLLRHLESIRPESRW